MANEPEGVRRKLIFDVIRRKMDKTRNEHMPAQPANFQELVDKLDDEAYPPYLQAMYIDHVRVTRRGISQSFRISLIL